MDYTVIQPNRTLRAYARGQLRGVWGQTALAYFVVSLVYLPSNIFSALNALNRFDVEVPIPSLTAHGFTILALVIAGPLYLGITGYFLKRMRSEPAGIQNMFEGLNRFGQGFALSFLTGLFTFLWLLLLIIPGVIKAFSYSMAFFIMNDNPGISPLEAIKQSRLMMKGYKWKLFTLYVSFTGWCLLGIASLFIGFFWITPYMYLSVANFYENLKKQAAV
jgi:uncharacterized membrane protein